MACARVGTSGEFTVAITQYTCCGESRVDCRWEKVHSLEQLEQGGRNPAALPTLGPWQPSLIDHSPQHRSRGRSLPVVKLCTR